MTDNQNLLAEYVQTGSDAAFRELVIRYVDLVYSTALRLVGGDKHRAEDVAQTVFVNLARVARTLPKEVKLGGWLHRDPGRRRMDRGIELTVLPMAIPKYTRLPTVTSSLGKQST